MCATFVWGNNVVDIYVGKSIDNKIQSKQPWTTTSTLSYSNQNVISKKKWLETKLINILPYSVVNDVNINV